MSSQSIRLSFRTCLPSTAIGGCGIQGFSGILLEFIPHSDAGQDDEHDGIERGG